MRNDARASAAAESGKSGRTDRATDTSAARPLDPMLAFESEAEFPPDPNVVVFAAPPIAQPRPRRRGSLRRPLLSSRQRVTFPGSGSRLLSSPRSR